MGPLNRPKIDQVQAWTSQCPFLYSRMSQDRPRVPQDSKVEAPSMPNDTHGLNNSARGPALLAALLEDPNQLMSFQPKGEDVQEIEAWRILDILSVGGGGFDAWYTENSAHFTRVQ